VETAQKDPGASPVLRAVLLEFQKKAVKANATLASATSSTAAREAVVEVEQAADSANVAAAADAGAAESTRKAVDLAHKAICLIKHEGTSA
jgi:hypothetical protein